jgi:hypothetical protein
VCQTQLLQRRALLLHARALLQQGLRLCALLRRPGPRHGRPLVLLQCRGEDAGALLARGQLLPQLLGFENSGVPGFNAGEARHA